MKVTIGERIKKIRKERGIPVECIAEQLGVSVSTIYRYENTAIEKIPVHLFDKLCVILGTTPAVLMGNEVDKNSAVLSDDRLPNDFKDPQQAMEFLLRLPMLAAFGGYDPSAMSEETIVEFANEILQQLKLVSYKYK